MEGVQRYFVEVAYIGTGYAGFQVQKNANSIQAEVEKAMSTFFRAPIELTGSSRTDAGVHAKSNFFHFDSASLPSHEQLKRAVYNVNAILPLNIVVKGIFEVLPDAHCRFDARSRQYEYRIHRFKDPFLNHKSYYFPYHVDVEILQEAAGLLLEYDDFTAFSKRNTQVKSFICNLSESHWQVEENGLRYTVRGNRFLRGMVRGLVGTMLKVGRGIKTMDDFRDIITKKDSSCVDFSVPPQGLVLTAVTYQV